MKKYLTIDGPLKVLTEKIRKDYFTAQPAARKLFDFNFIVQRFRVTPKLGKVLLTVLFFLTGLKSVAPDNNAVILLQPAPIRPFSELMHAIGMVETMGNPSAYNELENAVGIFQIRQVRVDDYNRRTGSTYVLEDMFDSKLSEKVFLYFASLYGPYHFEKIARAWNGSGPMTEFYWKRIKAKLN